MDRRPVCNLLFQMRARRDDPEANRLIAKVRPSPKECVSILSADPESYQRELREFGRAYLGPPGDALFQCGATEKPCVDAYGRLQPCLGLRDPELSYDLRNGGSLRDALDTFFPKVLQLRAKNPEYLRRCARCFLKGLCEQCPARSWSENGTLDTPVDYFCAVTHAQALEMGWLREGEHAWEVTEWQERME
jgi:radical SAM protein with 4Fe4S-binding SPASM domain